MHGENFTVSRFSICIKIKKKLGPARSLGCQKIRAASTMDMEQTRAERNVMLGTNPIWASSPQGMRHAALSRGAALRFLITQRQESEWISFFL